MINIKMYQSEEFIPEHQESYVIGIRQKFPVQSVMFEKAYCEIHYQQYNSSGQVEPYSIGYSQTDKEVPFNTPIAIVENQPFLISVREGEGYFQKEWVLVAGGNQYFLESPELIGILPKQKFLKIFEKQTEEEQK